MTTRLRTPLGDHDHVLGPPDAPVTLVEYGDYECPHCGRAHPIVASVLRQLDRPVRFAYRHFPLTEIHPHAEHAAEMAEAAGERGTFWPMHDLLFENQEALEDEDLIEYASQLGIEPGWSVSALKSGRYARRVQEDFMSGVRSGVNGTPTFFINGIRHDGPWDEASLRDALERAHPAPAGRK
jgi:protein-disulfide isomerase